MKVVYECINFKDLTNGDIFKLNCNHKIYMKTDYISNEYVRTNAIDLETGEFAYFEDFQPVYILECELKIKNYIN